MLCIGVCCFIKRHRWMCCVLEYVVSSSAIGGCVVYWSMLSGQAPYVDVLCIGVCCLVKRHRWMCCV